jgi:cell division protein ZapA
MSAQQVTVQIMGQEYTLACPSDAQEAFHQAVAKVDAAMCRIRDAGKIKTRDRIAVLAALNIAFEHTAGGTTASVASSAAHNPESASEAEADAQALQQLLARLDTALSEDGKLF